MHSTWRSLKFGDDVLRITYEDPHFCYDCTILVGVYGYVNATYTLLATEAEAAVIRLALNHPQIATLSAGTVEALRCTPTRRP